MEKTKSFVNQNSRKRHKSNDCLVRLRTSWHNLARSADTVCTLGQVPWLSFVMVGHKRCPHGKRKSDCAECKPSPHGKRKHGCAVCSPCPHGKVKHSRAVCSNKCPHGKWKYSCVKCTPCPHGKRKDSCVKCTPCPHGKLKSHCAKCNPCPHGKLKTYCAACKTARAAPSRSKRIKREPESSPEIKQESSPEVKQEPKIKQEPFTIRGYCGLDG